MGGRSVALICALVLLCSCNSHFDFAPTFTGQPMTLSIYSADTTSNNPARLYILVTGVGSHRVRLPLAFDTGSSGVTLNALALFPSSMVTSSGFIFPPGQSKFSYDGITVTNQNGTRVYGSPTTGRTEVGNLGFATVTFGDQYGMATTQTIPVFLYYAVRFNSDGSIASAQQQQGWFGVGDTPNLVNLSPSGGTAISLPACSPQTSGSCYVFSPLEYLNYSSGVDAGFILAPTPLQNCNISVVDSCPPSRTLQIGLTLTKQSAFVLSPLSCNWLNSYIGPTLNLGYLACHPQIQNSTISLDTGSQFIGAVWFDTGTPYFAINVPPGVVFPTSVMARTRVTFATPGGFTYSVVAGTDLDLVTVLPDSTFPTVIGLPYFTTNSFLLDYSTAIEGWQ